MYKKILWGFLISILFIAPINHVKASENISDLVIDSIEINSSELKKEEPLVIIARTSGEDTLLKSIQVDYKNVITEQTKSVLLDYDIKNNYWSGQTVILPEDESGEYRLQNIYYIYEKEKIELSNDKQTFIEPTFIVQENKNQEIVADTEVIKEEPIQPKKEESVPLQKEESIQLKNEEESQPTQIKVTTQNIETIELNWDKPSPQPTSKKINITAESTGSSNAEYKFFIEENGVWRVLQDYSSKNTYIWEPTTEGTYKISVHAKDKYSTKPYDAYKAFSFDVIKEEEVKDIKVTSDKLDNTPIHTSINITAESTGSSNAEYKFFIEENDVWRVLQDYSSKNIYTWTPQKEGKYKISVHSRDRYSTKRYEAYESLTYNIVREKVENIELNIDKKIPQPIDTEINIKAVSNGSSNPMYKFWIEQNGIWKVLQEYSLKGTYIWKPHEQGRYKISVHTKDKYSNKSYDSYKAFNYIVDKGKVNSLDVNFDKTKPQPVDTSFNISASVTGTNNAEYKFFIEENGVWKVLQDYSSKSTYTWTPQKEGKYKVSVHARDKDSNERYEKYDAYEYQINKARAESVILNLSKVGPQPILQPITIKASATGTHNAQYKFFIEENGVWRVLQDYSLKDEYTWIPQKDGEYTISVHGRDIKSTDRYESYTSINYKIDPAIIYYNSYYNSSYEELLELQLKYNPQTDYYGGGWQTAKAEDVSGFLNPNNFLQFYNSDTIDNLKQKIIINTPILNVRSNSSVSGEIIGQVHSGETYEVLDKLNGWYKIRLLDSVGWVHGAYVEVENSIKGQAQSLRTVEVSTDVLNVRSNPNLTGEIISQVQRNQIYVIQEIQEGWYKINVNGILGWISSSYANITNKAPQDMYQFLVLSGSSKISVNDLNNVLKGKGVLEGNGQAFIQASLKYNINEIYLISHALLETGDGWSYLAKGITIDTVDGEKVPPRTVYNMYGIGAYDSNPIKGGTEYAYKAGWFTPEAAIIEGAKFISERYVNNPSYEQNTLYKMRWNPDKPGLHQYATDIGWAYKQTAKMKQLYNQSTNFVLEFDIPKYAL